MKKTQVDIRSEAFKKACNMLGEYFDDVVILCSWQENGGTMHAQAVLGKPVCGTRYDDRLSTAR